ncbi:NAD kinase [Anaerobacillus arseniciselenatis]|uniref:NAD kinase n=1 Tax=Anaerobacillus arseniciselenatis TaxID=85682 RepID=A0A1S2LEY8_9BACI|nr:NAD kinase [Anaerobacillus arseniciselenatis]OIJ10926.1 NAD kinase [Anaerobacillus arseniciselenatis]
MADRRNVFLYYHPTNEVEEKLAPLIEVAKQYNFDIVSNYQEANIIISIGGDGTFLQALRKTEFQEDCLYLGINTGDHIGFYTDFTLNDIDSIVAAMKNEQVEVRKNNLIEVSVNGEKPFYCFNECSIRSNVIRTFVIDVYIDDMHFETFRGDGLIASTPTGSTAYNKSLGGAVVDPRLKAIQLTEISSLNNNEYRTLGAPLILSGDSTLTLKVVQDGNDHPIIGADNEALSIRHCHDIKVNIADKQVKMLKLKDNSFFQRVQKTFL